MRSPRRAIFALLALAALAFAGAASVSATQGDDHKVAICHRTASDTNPYVYIEVDVASLDAHWNNLPGHPTKYWKSDGTYRGIAHLEGDAKNDYPAEFGPADCAEIISSATPTPSVEATATPTPTVRETPQPTQSLIAPATATPKADVPNTAMLDNQPSITLNDMLFIIGLIFISASMVMAGELVVQRIRRR